jgi:hypothetical protein
MTSRNPTQDTQSPDNTTPVTRDISNACRVVPNEIPGVVCVGATGPSGDKARYSNYGSGVTDCGRSRRRQPLRCQRLPVSTAGSPRAMSSSTYPAYLFGACGSAGVTDQGATYCYLAGNLHGQSARGRRCRPDLEHAPERLRCEGGFPPGLDGKYQRPAQRMRRCSSTTPTTYQPTTAPRRSAPAGQRPTRGTARAPSTRIARLRTDRSVREQSEGAGASRPLSFSGGRSDYRFGLLAEDQPRRI